MDAVSYPSKNFDDEEIRVEFAVLHYTALPLEETLALFTDQKSKVSSHIVIAEDGRVFELVPCLNGGAKKSWHAGESHWHDGEKSWEGFNNFSLGIELENKNGNYFPFTAEQYESLIEVLLHLQGVYPALQQAERIIGHEQIAGFRGKCDPGRAFSWDTLFQTLFPMQDAPERESVLTPPIFHTFRDYLEVLPKPCSASFWASLNSLLETMGAQLLFRKNGA